MNIFISVLETALQVLVALFLGILCRKKALLNAEGIAALKKVALDICLPMVLVNAFATMEYSLSSLIIPALMFLLCLVGLGLGRLLARLLKLEPIAAYLATGFEAGMIGYALFALLYPQEAASSFAILDPGHTLFIFTIYKACLTGKADKKAILQDIATSPVIWGLVVGILLGATGLYGLLDAHGLSGTVDALTSYIGAPTGVIILLCIGYDLDLRSIEWKQMSKFIVLRLVSVAVMLLLLLTVDRFLLGNIIHTGAAVLFFLLPPPYILPIFSDDERQRASLSSAISALTLLTILLFAVMAFIVA